jgi:TonB family protein
MFNTRSIQVLSVAVLFTIFSATVTAQPLAYTLAAVTQVRTASFELLFSEQMSKTDKATTPTAEPLNRSAYFANWRNFLTHFLTYPDSARQNFIQGTVKVEIEVNELGDVVSATLVQGLGYGCDEAVLGLVKHMPRWTPRLKNGEPTAQKLILPVVFKLMD